MDDSFFDESYTSKKKKEEKQEEGEEEGGEEQEEEEGEYSTSKWYCKPSFQSPPHPKELPSLEELGLAWEKENEKKRQETHTNVRSLSSGFFRFFLSLSLS